MTYEPFIINETVHTKQLRFKNQKIINILNNNSINNKCINKYYFKYNLFHLIFEMQYLLRFPTINILTQNKNIDRIYLAPGLSINRYFTKYTIIKTI